MPDEKTRLRELLAYHGADISRWPAEAQPLGFRALKTPGLAAIIVEEQRFEEILLKYATPLPSHDFTQNIIAAALMRTPMPQVSGWIQEVFTEVRPMALAAMLVIGFAIGFGMTPHIPTQQQQTAAVPTVSDDEGALL